MDTLSNFYNLIVLPRSGLEWTKRHENWMLLFFLFVWAQAAKLVSGMLLGTSVFKSPLFLNYGFPALIGLALVGWVVSVSILHFFATLLGGHGGIMKFFYLWGWSFFPFIFFPLFAFWVFEIADPFRFIMVVFFFFWLLFFRMEIIAVNYKIGIGRAFMVLASPFLLLLTLSLFVGIVFFLKVVLGL